MFFFFLVNRASSLTLSTLLVSFFVSTFRLPQRHVNLALTLLFVSSSRSSHIRRGERRRRKKKKKREKYELFCFTRVYVYIYIYIYIYVYT